METLKLYAAHLAEFDSEDVRAVIRDVAHRKRAEGETAFPEMGALIGPLKAMRNRRLRDARIERERQESNAIFWTWAACWMEDTGNTEAELLERFPAFKGTKPR